MMQRPWRTHRHQKKNEAAYAALGEEALKIFNAEPAPVTRIENMIRHDVNQADLSKWRNEGWQIVHYQFVSSGDAPVLAVVMERVVEVVPEPEPIAPPEPSPEVAKIAVNQPDVVIVQPNGTQTDEVDEFVKMLRSDADVEDVITFGNERVIEVARQVSRSYREQYAPIVVPMLEAKG